jgi:hypothetical protein
MTSIAYQIVCWLLCRHANWLIQWLFLELNEIIHLLYFYFESFGGTYENILTWLIGRLSRGASEWLWSWLILGNICGCFVGQFQVGWVVGAPLGCFDGKEKGCFVGRFAGWKLGLSDGCKYGLLDGCPVGALNGCLVGTLMDCVLVD